MAKKTNAGKAKSKAPSKTRKRAAKKTAPKKALKARKPSAKKKPVHSHRRTADLEKKVLGYLTAGASEESACACVGITARTFRNWKAADDANDEIPEEGKLRQRVVEAQVSLEGFCLGALAQQCADGNSQACKTLLAYKDPKRFNTSRHEVTGTGGGPIKVETSERLFGDLTNEKLDERLKAAEAGKAP